jgi:hypothetical protein
MDSLKKIKNLILGLEEHIDYDPDIESVPVERVRALISDIKKVIADEST